MARLGEMCLDDVELPIGFKSILLKAPMCPSLLAGGGWTRDVLNPIQPGLMSLCPCCHLRFREKNSKIKGVEGKKNPGLPCGWKGRHHLVDPGVQVGQEHSVPQFPQLHAGTSAQFLANT